MKFIIDISVDLYYGDRIFIWYYTFIIEDNKIKRVRTYKIINK